MQLLLEPMNYRDHCEKWLLCWQGMLGLSDGEKAVLVELLVEYQELVPKILDEELRWKNLWDTETRQRIQTRLSISRFALANHLSKFRQGGVFTIEGYQNERILPTLIPQQEFTIKFKV